MRSIRWAKLDIFKDAYLLNHVWEVSEDDARRASQSAHDTLRRFFCSKLPFPIEPSAQDMAEFFIDRYRDEPHKAIDAILKTEWIAKEVYFPNVSAFYDKLARLLKRKPRKTGILPTEHWKLWMIGFWVKSLRGRPPVCLMSDGLLIRFWRLPSESAVRKEINRLGLFRPKSPCFGQAAYTPEGYIKFERRSRGAVTKKK